MADIIDGLIEEYHSSSSAVSRKISSLESSNSQGRSMQLCTELDESFQELRDVLNNINIEHRSLDSAAKGKYSGRISQLKNDFSTLEKDYNRARFNANRTELFSGSFNNANNDDQRLLSTSEQSRMDTEKLKGARSQLLQTEDQATDILEDLRRQREVIERTKGNLDTGHSEMSTINRIINSMTRRQLIKRISYICVIFVLIIMIALILYFSLKPKKD